MSYLTPGEIRHRGSSVGMPSCLAFYVNSIVSSFFYDYSLYFGHI